MKYQNRIAEVDKLQKEIQVLRPLGRNALKQLKEYYRIGLTYSSNAIEGNSLTESETKVVIEDGITIGGKPLRDHYEAIGHSEAFDHLYKLVKNDEITESDILRLHKLLYMRVDPNEAGKYRKEPIIVTGTDFEFPQPSKLKGLMQKFIKEIPGLKKKLHPIEFAALLHIRLATIHPFVDGNGRAARLLMNLALMQAGYPITIIPPVVRADYIDAIRKANKGDNQMFINFVSCMVVEAEKDYLRLLRHLNVEGGA
jgi:Fic family protein